MSANPLRQLESFGQSIWTDYISRHMIESGGLKKLIENDGISGVTSNPSIFEKAIAETHDYDTAIRGLAEQNKSPEEIYEILTVEDIQRTADQLRPTYDRLKGADGFVSLEVAPTLADDTEATIEQARRFWKEVNRPNLMIKVPGTKAGVPAIRQLLSEGININITLLFGLQRYREVAEAYLAALESRLAKGQQVKNIASVASFFLSRIDVLVDPKLDKTAQSGSPDANTAKALLGTAAIASAVLAYKIYEQLFGDMRFKSLAAHGARPQRLLWASTSTKNPAYSDVKYVEPLIGHNTINTLPLETIDAYRDHGKPHKTLPGNTAEAQHSLDALKKLGIDIDAVTNQLELEGVEKFIKAYNTLLKSVNEKSAALVGK